MTQAPWPPPYAIRTSPRARHVRLKVSADKGLEVIVPLGFDRHRVPEILERRRRWLEATLYRMGQRRAHLHQTSHLPERVHLRAIGETWSVHYLPRRAERFQLRSDGENRLVIEGPSHDERVGVELLRRWVQQWGRIHLVPWLQSLSEATGLTFTQARVRRQRTRWGSCTAHRHISLNCKLMFLPPELVRHVLVHELCHTVHLDHSPAFWSLVERHDSACHRLRGELKRAWTYVPAWIDV
jgi:predicted metal-dependent hydrolase